MQNFDIAYPWMHDVLRIKEDSTGFIWMHDGKDYYRYNGHQIYACDLTNVLGKKKYDYDVLGDIVFAKDNILMAVDNQLHLFHPFLKTINTIWKSPNGETLEHLYEDDTGDIWVFTHDKVNDRRLVYLSKDRYNFSFLMHLPEFNEDTGIFWDFEVTDKEGVLYIHDRLGGLLMLGKDGKEKKLSLRDQSEFDNKYACSQFRLDNTNTLWRIYEEDFEIYDETLQAFIRHPITNSFAMQNYCNKGNGEALLNLRSIYQDSKGRIWFANAASYLLLYKEKLNDFINFRKDLVDELGEGGYDIEHLYEDKNGNLWGLKKGGVFKIKDKANYFKSYTVDTHNSDHPIYQDSENETLVKILDFYDDFAIKNTSVHSIAEDGDQNIYYQDATLTFKIDAQTDAVEVLPFFTVKEKVHLYIDDEIGIYSCWDNYYIFDRSYNSSPKDFPINKIEKTFRQQNGTIWMLGLIDQHNKMFGKLNSTSLEFEGNLKLPSNQINFSEIYVTDVDEDEQGNLWLSSDEGIYMLDLNSEKIQKLPNEWNYQNETYTISNIVDQLDYHQDAHIWFKSKYEIGYLDTENEKLIHLLPIDESYYGTEVKIVPIGDSVVWIGNKLGLAYHNFNNGRSIQVSQREGIDTKDAVRVFEQLSDGNLVAGTNNGLYKFNPDSLLSRYQNIIDLESKVPLEITSFSYVSGRNDSLYTVTGRVPDVIELSHNDKLITLEYSLIDFGRPELHRFQHWLEGYENDWSSFSKLNNNSYSNLPPGEYTFHVRGNIGSEVLSKNILSIGIQVSSAWYNTWWARILIVGLTSFLVYLYSNIKYKQSLKFERLRADISKDLHDDVGTLLTGIAMQSELLEDNVEQKVKPIANKIATSSREAMDRMRDTVWAIDSRKDTTMDLYDRILDYAQDILLPSDIKINPQSDISSKEYKLKPNIRQQVYLIAKESLNNISKHSQASEVKIKLNITKSHLALTICDNGGSKVLKTSGQGISNMKQRARSIDGTYSFEYNNGFETTLKVDL